MHLAMASITALLLVGCGAPPEPAPNRPPSPPVSVAPKLSDLGDGQIDQYRSARFDLLLPLPDRAGWRIEDRKEPWLVAVHAASSTSLLVRVFRYEGRADRAACEQRARLFRDLPPREGSTFIERRRIDVPTGFDTLVELGVADTPPGASVEGFALAFGGWARRCFAFVATTRAAGAEAQRVVAARLAAVVEISLRGLKLENELEPTGVREPRR
jgi:hypothetical protein